MLQAKTIEQKAFIENVVKKHVTSMQYCEFVSANVYRNYEECVELNLMCKDCNCVLSVDIPFGMMAEIVDYLREQNKTEVK